MYNLETITGIQFELSSHCNSKCPQCPRYDTYGRIHKDLNITHLNVDIIKNLPMEKMKNLKKIIFCGNFGDPLMHPELDKIVDFFKDQEIWISTNASLRKKEWWNNFGKNKNISVSFCLDGIGKTHEIYRRNTSYTKIIENAKSFIGAGGTAHWQFIVFRHNEHQMDEAKKLSETLGFKKIEFLYSDRFDFADKTAVYNNGRYLYDLEKPSKQIALREELNVETGEKFFFKFLNKNKGTISCVWKKRQEIYIHSDGIVYPCCMLGGLQTNKKIEKLLLRKLVNNYDRISLYCTDLENIISTDIFQKKIPNSFNGDPFTHPICSEHCSKSIGKYYKREEKSNKTVVIFK